MDATGNPAGHGRSALKAPSRRPVVWLLALGCLGVALLLADPARAQGTGAIAGTVFDAETGKPLPFASVGVVDTSTQPSAVRTGKLSTRGKSAGPGGVPSRTSKRQWWSGHSITVPHSSPSCSSAYWCGQRFAIA